MYWNTTLHRQAERGGGRAQNAQNVYWAIQPIVYRFITTTTAKSVGKRVKRVLRVLYR